MCAEPCNSCAKPERKPVRANTTTPTHTQRTQGSQGFQAAAAARGSPACAPGQSNVGWIVQHIESAATGYRKKSSICKAYPMLHPACSNSYKGAAYMPQRHCITRTPGWEGIYMMTWRSRCVKPVQKSLSIFSTGAVRGQPPASE